MKQHGFQGNIGIGDEVDKNMKFHFVFLVSLIVYDCRDYFCSQLEHNPRYPSIDILV